jgi:hypothetical protein
MLKHKKIILVLLLILFTQVNMNVVNADYCDSKILPETCVDYVFYTNWAGDPRDNSTYRLVSIYVPENIEYLEYLVMTGELRSWYFFKLIYLNSLLIKRGYDPIY